MQPDSLISNPINSQSFNRLSYTWNNPLRYTDPSGHSVDCAIGEPECLAGTYKYTIIASQKPKDVKPGQEEEYIKAVAKENNIKLAPGDDWGFFSGKYSSQALGFTVWSDKALFGDPVLDNYVYMTSSAFAETAKFNTPNGPVTVTIGPIEFASIMAHEAEHSWQEYYFEIGVYTHLPQKQDPSNPDQDSASFTAITEADSYKVQQIWLNNHGVTGGDFYNEISRRAEDERRLAISLGVDLSIPLPIFNIGK